MTTIEKLKQGCGEDFSHPCSAFRMCRKGDLCPICQAKLSQHQEDVEEFNKNIDEFLNKLIKQQTSETPMLSDIEWEEGYNTGVRDIISFVLDYFKSSLDDRDTEEKVSHIVKKDDDEVGELYEK